MKGETPKYFAAVLSHNVPDIRLTMMRDAICV